MVFRIEAIWAGVMVCLMVAILWYNYRVVRLFDTDPKLAATRLFLDGDAARVFKIFAFGITCYGLTALVGVVTLSVDPDIYRIITKIGSLLLFGSWVVFMRTLTQVFEVATE